VPNKNIDRAIGIANLVVNAALVVVTVVMLLR